MRHIIGKQIIEVKLQGSKDAFAIQQKMSQVFWETVAPAMEALFDKLTPEDELIRIEKLEISIGALTEQQIISGEWLSELLINLEQTIKSAINKKSPGTQVLPLRSGYFEQWLYFLQYGNLPWHISPAPEQDWQQKILEALGMDAAAVTQLRHLLNTNPRALQRLTLQYSGSFLQHVTELFIGHNAAILHATFMELKDACKTIAEAAATARRSWTTGSDADEILNVFISQTISEKTATDNPILEPSQLKQRLSQYARQAGRGLEVDCWKLVITELAKTTRKPAPNDLLRLVFDQIILKKIQSALTVLAFKKKTKYPNLKAFFEQEGIKPQKKIVAQKLPEIISSPTPDEINLEETPSASILPSDKKPKQEPLQESTTPNEQKRTASKEPVPRESLQPESPLTPKNEPAKPYPNQKEEILSPGEDGWHIPTAGLVLLHPFLSTLFEKLNLLKDRQFDGEWNQNKAAMLLHFLATGEDTAQEYNMVLPKLLCAIPFNRPLDYSIELTNEEKLEAETLLSAVVEHWGALGSTSPNGLRGNFLVRDGKLLKTEKSWRLQVERKSPIDMLLDRLPWGLGLVKLPWMEELLMVEWN